MVVIARFQGTGTRKIMLLGHMDTVTSPGSSPSGRSASKDAAHTVRG